MRRSLQIAKRELSQCLVPEGILGGNHSFLDMWARDSLFATFGASSRVAKKTIETFLKFQKKDGQIPYRIFRWRRLTPNFRSVQSGGFVPDGGLMAVIVARKFVKTYKEQIQKILNFYKRKYSDGLISEWFQCEWADAVLKIGKTLYTNVLYWKATEDKKIKKKINETFWNGEFFADWVDWKRHDYFASHSNMLAIIFGLATDTQARSILRFAKKYCWNGWTLQTNYPRYPWWRIPLQNYVFGMRDYHNGLAWLQPGILYSVALHKVGQKQEASHVFKKISEKIIEYNGVYEVYEKNGAPVRRFFYKSEHQFAWSAGLFVWAYRDYFSD